MLTWLIFADPVTILQQVVLALSNIHAKMFILSHGYAELEKAFTIIVIIKLHI